MKRNGFTLIELLVTITLLGILLGVGIPSLQTLMANMTIRSNTEKLINSLAYARGEAVARVKNVSVRSASVTESGGAVTSVDWSDGWMVFVDEAGNCSFDAGDEVLRVIDISADDVTITPPSNTTACIRFNRLGENDNATAAGFGLSKTGASSAAITVSNTGYTSKD